MLGGKNDGERRATDLQRSKKSTLGFIGGKGKRKKKRSWVEFNSFHKQRGTEGGGERTGILRDGKGGRGKERKRQPPHFHREKGGKECRRSYSSNVGREAREGGKADDSLDRTRRGERKILPSLICGGRGKMKEEISVTLGVPFGGGRRGSRRLNLERKRCEKRDTLRGGGGV